MKKVFKVMAVLLILAALVFAVSQPVFAKDSADNILSAVNSGNAGNVDNGVNDVANSVINFLWVISIIVTVIVIMVIGLKYIIGSTQEKAEYKKSLIPLVVGALLIVFATTIVKFLFTR